MLCLSGFELYSRWVPPIYLSTLRWIYLRKMRGYPQFSFWISLALFNGMIYIFIFWGKKILPALVSTVLKGRLIDSIAHYPAAWTFISFTSRGILSTAGLLSNSTIVYIVNLPYHETLVYPPKIYFPTLTIVTVGPLPSQREWNVIPAQPSTDARQQRIQRELTLLITSESHLFNWIRFFLLSPTITESCKPRKIVNFLNLTKKLWSGKTVKNSAPTELIVFRAISNIAIYPPR